MVVWQGSKDASALFALILLNKKFLIKQTEWANAELVSEEMLTLRPQKTYIYLSFSNILWILPFLKPLPVAFRS